MVPWRAVGILKVGLAVVFFCLAGLAQAQVSRVESAAAGCRNLTLSQKDFSALSVAWRSSRKLSAHLRLVVTRRAFRRLAYGGQCGSTKWAYASFDAPRGEHVSQQDQIRLQDGPDVFKRRAGGEWRDISDTGGDVPCGGRVGLPKPLVKIWGLTCS